MDTRGYWVLSVLLHVVVMTVAGFAVLWLPPFVWMRTAVERLSMPLVQPLMLLVTGGLILLLDLFLQWLLLNECSREEVSAVMRGTGLAVLILGLLLAAGGWIGAARSTGWDTLGYAVFWIAGLYLLLGLIPYQLSLWLIRPMAGEE